MPLRTYLTTPIYYVNDRPHIGHAYCTVLADAARRWHALLGDQTYFLTGTDEHGQKVQEAAQKRGVDPQAHCDEMHLSFKELWPTLGCEPNQFMRTTQPRHKAVVQKALQKLWDNGQIEARTFEGWYCIPCERYWTEKDLQDGKCPSCQREVVRLAEKNYFFAMSRYQDRLRSAIESKQIEILPANRANEVLGFLREPLHDLCISRPKARLSWGIELPFDKDYVTYVWFDALLNYASGIGFLDAEPPALPEQWPEPALSGHDNFEAWWPNVTHLLGKDILTTHTVYWPTMMMGLAEAFGLPHTAWLPRRFVVTGWWLQGDVKMSKSLGNVVSPLDMKDRYGWEVLRWFLLREMPVGQDANFSEAALLRRNNSDLANDLGNLLQRTVALCDKSFGGLVPASLPLADTPSLLALRNILDTLLDRAGVTVPGDPSLPSVEPIAQTVRSFRLHKTLADVLALLGALNAVLSLEKPFSVVRDDPQRAGAVVYLVLDGLRIAANLLQPVLPSKAPEILRRIGWQGGILPVADLAPGQLQSGSAVHAGPPLLPKFELPVAVPEAQAPEEKVESLVVDIDTFARSELRVGRVLLAEPVPKSSKLLRLLIDLGEAQPRQILSGIAETIAPADLLGRQVLVIANLPPRKMMGLESHGMLLVAEDETGKRVALHPARDVPAGAGVH